MPANLTWDGTLAVLIDLDTMVKQAETLVARVRLSYLSGAMTRVQAVAILTAGGILPSPPENAGLPPAEVSRRIDQYIAAWDMLKDVPRPLTAAQARNSGTGPPTVPAAPRGRPRARSLPPPLPPQLPAFPPPPPPEAPAPGTNDIFGPGTFAVPQADFPPSGGGRRG